jgi:nitrogen fixation/metabolism regulation signal transduction histidine kinase
MPGRPLLSLKGKLAFWLMAVAAAAAAGGVLAARLWDSGLLAWSRVMCAALLPVLWLAARLMRPVAQLLRALSATVASYREGDFSRSLAIDRDDELGDLMAAHNELAGALRSQRAHLVQRELLLDTVMQNSPVALLLVDAQERIAYANIAARHLLSEGRSLTGLHFGDALMRAPPALRGAVAGAGDSLFSTEIEGSEETFHLSQRAFILQGRTFRLYLLKRLTRELSRQEVATWKKLIRVLSHELNNSLGPLSSLAHSGAEIARRADQSTLPAVFAAIAERAEHLHQFVSGYATFARLPAPRPQPVAWDGFADVELLIRCLGTEQRIEVRDRGAGMSQAVLAQALLPFYSTKRSGTGLGLALAREIAEAHGGRIQLQNREGGGLCVTLDLPRQPD